MVSVIVPVYNNETYLGQAINSIMQQTYKDIEIIVVDDGSTDNSSKIAEDFEQVKYIYQANSGPSAARNKGVSASRGEYIAFLDSDDMYAKNKIEVQVRTLEQNKDVDIVYNDCIVVDKNLNYINTLKSEGVYENEKDFLCMLLFRQIIPIPPSIMLRRKCFEDGYFYNNGYKHAEDYEFIIRLAQKYKFKYIPKPLYIYRRHENNLTNAHNLQQDREINVLRELGYSRIEEIVGETSFSDLDKRYLLAKIYIKMSEYKLAKEILLQLKKEGFNNSYLGFYLGNCCYFLGEYEEAIPYYKDAIAKDSKMAEAYNNLACIYAGKDSCKAVELLNKALLLRLNYMDARHNMDQITGGYANYKITVRELRRVLTNYLSITGN